MIVVDAGKQLDKLRRQYELSSIPKASFYVYPCRLHEADVEGPITVCGWRQYVIGQPRNKDYANHYDWSLRSSNIWHRPGQERSHNLTVSDMKQMWANDHDVA